jgi:hypothetical protein
MAPRYEFREDLLPISLLLTSETLQAADVEGIFAYYRSLCERRLRFVAISDVRAAIKLPDAATCLRFGEEANHLAEQLDMWSLGGAVVLESALIRGALSAIEWLYHPRRPTTYFHNMHGAVTWAIRKLEAAGTPIPPAIYDFQRQQARAGGLYSQAPGARQSE